MGRFFNSVIALAVVAWIGIAVFQWREKNQNRELWIPYHGASSWTVLSLDPEPKAGADFLSGTRILAKADVRATPGLRKAISDLERASQQKELEPAACFIPRHGLRVVKSGVTYDLLICYECSQLAFYAAGAFVKQLPFATARATSDDLDRILVEIVRAGP
jgi:hypothetical protein